MRGSAGVDRVDYSSRIADLTVRVDSLINDGAGGENDDVDGSVEDVTGGAGDDFLVGSTGDNHLVGGAGDDVLYGEFGTDKLTGGLGSDELYGGYGDDILLGIDGWGGNDLLDGQSLANDECHSDAGDVETNCER
jgi:Ca2+-binding RTX toxin-like protein